MLLLCWSCQKKDGRDYAILRAVVDGDWRGVDFGQLIPVEFHHGAIDTIYFNDHTIDTIYFNDHTNDWT